VRSVKLQWDDDGFLLMDAFADDDVDPAQLTGDAVRLPAPPPLADSDWLAAVAATASTPLDGVTDQPSAAADDAEAQGDGPSLGPSPWSHPAWEAEDPWTELDPLLGEVGELDDGDRW
jgi:hypothetical protein